MCAAEFIQMHLSPQCHFHTDLSFFFSLIALEMRACKNLHLFMHMLPMCTRTLRAPCSPLCLRQGEGREQALSFSIAWQLVAAHFGLCVSAQSGSGPIQLPGCTSLPCSGCCRISQVFSASDAGWSKAMGCT